MAITALEYGTNGQTITCTVDSLANAAARQSTVVDNTSNKFLDALVSAKLVAGGSGTSASGYVEIWAFATVNDGTDYTEGAGATDAAITMVSPTNLRLVGVVNVVANSTTYRGGPFSVAAAFGGILPAKWGLVVRNQSGGTLGTGNELKYQGIKAATA